MTEWEHRLLVAFKRALAFLLKEIDDILQEYKAKNN